MISVNLKQAISLPSIPPAPRKVPIYTIDELIEISHRMSTNVPLKERDIKAILDILERTYEGIFSCIYDTVNNLCEIHYQGYHFHTIHLK